MKTVGIVSEFNPFHNGHKHLIDTTKKSLDADAVIAVMSGNFTQRGEIASFDMHSRAEIACQNGVDLVLEIPPQFVLNSAQFYAYHSVYLLHALGMVDYLSFGSESGNLKELLALPKPDIKTVKNKMKSGISYAKAVGDSYLLQSANNILGREYLNALQQLHSPMIPFTIKREAVAHDATAPSGNFASASYIRQAMKDGGDVSAFVPSLPDSAPVLEESLLPMLNYRLACGREHGFSKIQNISEGLEHRILAARGKENFQDLIDAVKCKRYPQTRIRRALYSILLEIEKSEEAPNYTRVLAFTETGQKLLKKARKTASVTIYSRIKKPDIFQNRQLQKELFCNEIFKLAQQLSKRGQ